MGVVAAIVVPAPPDLQPTPDGHVTEGQAYALTMPAVAIDPLRITNRGGQTLTMAPAEMAFRDETGAMDYIVGSSPAEVTVRNREARYFHSFPAAEDVFVARAEGVKHWTRLKDFLGRAPAVYLGAGLEFGFSYLIGGVPLPPGRHESIDAFGFNFPRPFATDLAEDRVNGYYEVVDSDAGQVLFIWFDAAWFSDPDRVYPVTIDPPVGTSTSATATADGAKRRVLRFPSNGVLLAAINSGSTLLAYVSSDNGQTWVAPTTGATIATTGTAATLTLDEDERIHVEPYTTSGTYYVHGTPDAARTSFTWSALFTVQTGTNNADAGIVAARYGTGRKALVFYEVTTALPDATLFAARLNIAADGTITKEATVTARYEANFGVPFNPAVDIDSAATVHLAHRAHQSGWLYWPMTFSGGVWTLGTQVVVETGIATATGATALALTGQNRPVVVYQNGATALKCRQLISGSFLTVGPASGTGSLPAITPTSFAVVCKGDDIYIWFTTTAGLQYIKYDAAANAWGSIVVADADTTAKHVSVRRDTTGGRASVLYTTGSASPYTVKSFDLLLNQTPSMPTLSVPAAFDTPSGLTFTITHNDADGGNTTGVYVKVGNQWWDGTNLVAAEPGAPIAVAPAPTATLTIPGSKFTTGQTYQIVAATVDPSGAKGPYNTTPAVTKASVKPAAAISSPAAGATITSARVRVQATMTVAGGLSPKQYIVQLYNQAGSAVLSGPTTVNATGALDYEVQYTLVSGTSYQVGVTPVDSGGLSGTEVKRSFTVSASAPKVPVLTVTPNRGTAVTALSATNSAPVAPQPAVSTVRFERTADGGLTVVTVALAANENGVASASDRSAPSVTVQYRAAAIGANGVESYSAWQAATPAFDSWWFIPLDGSPAVELAHNTQVNWRPETDVQVPQTQSEFRREFRGRTYTRLADITTRLSERGGRTALQWRELLVEHEKNKVVGYLKSPQGDVWRGTIKVAGGNPNDAFLREESRLSFRQTGVSP